MNDRQARSERERPAECLGGALFDLLWTALTDLLGSAATATIMRRSAKRAQARAPRLRELRIERTEFEYRYDLPASWLNDVQSAEDVRELMKELQPLLEELTGPVVLHRLQAIPEFVTCGLFPSEDDR